MPDLTPTELEPAIAVHGLTKRFGRRLAIDGLSLTLNPGDICALAGANGGGKSTALRILAGLMAPDEGAGTVLGSDLIRATRLIRHRIGYLPQRNMLYATLSVRENLRFRAAVFGLCNPARAAELQIAEFGLTQFASTATGQLSGGWSRQVELAAVLINCPRLLLLDEPTVGLDPAARRTIWRRLTSLAVQGTAILLSTHDIGEARRCSHILLLSEGRVSARGSPREVASRIRESDRRGNPRT